MALMSLSPLSPPCFAASPHELLSSGYPAVPNPIRESLVLQSFSLFPTIPIRAFELFGRSLTALKPSLLQFCCKEASATRDFHASRPSEVLRYWPSAIRECKEVVAWFKTINLLSAPTFIPRQILVKDVLQYVGSLVSPASKFCPLEGSYSFLSLQKGESYLNVDYKRKQKDLKP